MAKVISLHSAASEIARKKQCTFGAKMAAIQPSAHSASAAMPTIRRERLRLPVRRISQSTTISSGQSN